MTKDKHKMVCPT